jgi:hypothetical protein
MVTDGCPVARLTPEQFLVEMESSTCRPNLEKGLARVLFGTIALYLSHMPENRRPPIRRTIRWRAIVSTVLYLAVAASVSYHCYRNNMFDIDLLGYAGSVALADTHDIVRAHQLVYREPLTPHLRGLDRDAKQTDTDGKQAIDLRRRAADPYYAAIFLPYFAIKPLYLLTLEAAHGVGFSVIDSSRNVSVLFYFGIALMLWVYTRSWLSLLVLVLPETMVLGQSNEPDGMSCFLLLLGLWLVFVKRRDMGLLALVLAIWVRPENVLLCLLVILVLLIDGRLDLPNAAVLALLCVGSDLLINHFGFPWRELYHHLVGGEAGTGNSLALADYFRSVMKGIRDLLHSPAPVFALLWLVCFPLVGKEFRQIMGITLLFSAGRFILFPPYEPRYYPLFFITTSIAAVLSIKNNPYLQGIAAKRAGMGPRRFEAGEPTR